MHIHTFSHTHEGSLLSALRSCKTEVTKFVCCSKEETTAMIKLGGVKSHRHTRIRHTDTQPFLQFGVRDKKKLTEKENSSLNGSLWLLGTRSVFLTRFSLYKVSAGLRTDWFLFVFKCFVWLVKYFLTTELYYMSKLHNFQESSCRLIHWLVPTDLQYVTALVFQTNTG